MDTALAAAVSMNMDTALAALERVFGAFDAQHGCPRDALDAAERRLQIRLPVALTTPGRT